MRMSHDESPIPDRQAALSFLGKQTSLPSDIS